MFPMISPPDSVQACMAQYREVFCRDEGFEWVSRYVTGLFISPNKTVQGRYELHVFPKDKPRPSRRARHEAVFEAGWDDEQLMVRHREVIAPAYRGCGRAVMRLDWTSPHHERGDHIHGVKRRYDDDQKRMSRYQTVLTAGVGNRERCDG